MSHIGEVIGWKFDHQEGMSTKGNEITAFPGGIPSQSDQDLWTVEYDAYVAANAYKELRSDNYPSIQEQLDAIYWDKINATTTWVDTVAAVKADHPKPI